MRHAVAAIAIVGWAQTAGAADLPAKAPPLKAATVVSNWTGLYVNGGFGYGLWAADTTTTTPAGAPALIVPQTQGGKGWLGRIGAGYDYQFTSKIIAGVFADYDFSSLKGTIQDGTSLIAGEIKQESSWAAGARIGWLLAPQLLSYTNAGYTSAQFSGATLTPSAAGGTVTGVTQGFTRSGWFLGGGFETALWNGFFWRNEYRYAYYGTQTIADTSTAGAALNNITFKPTVQTFTTQVVYKFNPPGAPAPVHEPVATLPASWTGLYVNAGVGYGIWAADTSAASGVNQTQGGKGWLGLAGAGYDAQIAPRVVLGVFGDFNFSSLKGTIQDQGAGLAGDIKQTRAWAAGARAGWLVTQSVLTYVNGGYTNARFSDATMLVTASGANTGFSTSAFTKGGWFVGGGAEAPLSFMPGLYWRNEYRYANYQSTTVSDCTAAGACNASINFKPVVQTVTTQLVYRFGGGPAARF
jgi:outer membrane immunogenic protein